MIYRLCEAKFLSEKATGVGHDSYVAVLQSGGTERIIYTEQLEEVRRIWETEGRSKIPPLALKAIEEELKKGRTR